MRTIYLIGSLRNPVIRDIGSSLRSDGHDVFDDWHSAGPDADDHWQKYEQERGVDYAGALAGYSASHTFNYDREHLGRCDTAILVMPAGKSAHLELGFACGLGKSTYVLFGDEPTRWDVMYKFADKVFFDLAKMRDYLNATPLTPRGISKERENWLPSVIGEPWSER